MHRAFTTKFKVKSGVLINEVRIQSPQSIEEELFPPTDVKAIWDTGATHTCINKSLANKLKLKPISKRDINGVGGKSTCDVYLIDLILPNNVGIRDVQVTGVEIYDGVGFLIGMDIIALGDFGVSHYNNTTTFSFRIPSKSEVNYIEEMQIQQTHGVNSYSKNRRRQKNKLANRSRKKNRKKKRK